MKEENIITRTKNQNHAEVLHRINEKGFSTIMAKLADIRVFHTDGSSKFKNWLIDETLEVFGICRSLSKKGCPYDNAVLEYSIEYPKNEDVAS